MQTEAKRIQRLDARFRIKENWVRRYKKAFKAQKVEHSPAYLELLGCTFEDLFIYLESKFKEGMNWDNYGGKDGWHIDHKRPCASFDLSDIEKQRNVSIIKIYNLYGLQIIEAKDHYLKTKEDIKMPKTLIASNPDFKRVPLIESHAVLNVAEMFCDTIQGESISTGIVSIFLRLQGCTLDCKWCDSVEVWREGNPYAAEEIFALMEEANLIEKLKAGQHLILTGGSPLKQQTQLATFVGMFIIKYGFKPFIEIENESVLMPFDHFESLVDQWNNSPKLSNSGMKDRARLKPHVIEHLNTLQNSWFKFVVKDEADWEEIERDYLPLIDKSKIILMPEGATQDELAITRPLVVEMAIKHNVRFCDRLHVTIWNHKTGV